MTSEEPSKERVRDILRVRGIVSEIFKIWPDARIVRNTFKKKNAKTAPAKDDGQKT